ncbi:MAG: hypothetical protein JO249_02630 [Acidobacteria bacterium]|nr:hypothetical protein [Acidobacteriota bacterium]
MIIADAKVNRVTASAYSASLFVWLSGVLNPDGSCRGISGILSEAQLQ